VLVLVDLITHTVGYSSVLDYFSVVLYVFAACTLVSLLIFKLDKLKNFSEKSRILIASTLILVISFAVVGYVIYKMSEATKIAVTSNGMVSAKEFDEPKVDPEQLSKNTEFEVSSKLLAKNESGILIMEGNEFARVDENTPSSDLANKYAELISLDPIQDPDEFLSQYDNLISQAPQAVNLLLGRAIRGGLETKYLLEILNRGGEFSGGHLALLVINRTLEDIKLLENFGLDLTQRSLSGRDILAESLLNTEREALFDYLVENRQFDSDTASQALLDVVIRSEQLRLGDIYIKKLVDRGFSLNSDDSEVIKEFNRINPQFYSLLEEIKEL
jgi:hypothetical protein